MNKNNHHIDAVIQQWAVEKPDLESQEMKLIAQLANCSALIFQKLENLYATFGINSGEFDVLSALRRSGAPYQLSPTRLFSTLMITSGTMTNRLQQLKKKELISRAPNPDDARSLLVSLTESGLALIDALIYEHVALEKSLNSLLPETSRKALEEGLGQWLEQLSHTQ